MEPKRRQELLERRKQLQDELRAQREHDAYYDDVRWITSRLEELGVPFEYVHDLDPLGDWLRASFPFLDEEIDWWGLTSRRLARFRYSRQEDGEILVQPTSDAAVHRWLRAVVHQQRMDSERVTAFYGRGTPSLALSLEDVVRHAVALAHGDCWLIPASRSWVIQCTNSDLVWALPAPELAQPPA